MVRMIKLGLSPYSAGTTPLMISIDSTALTGNWLEKTRLCWSVMGWPSTLKLASACSPRGWKRPFESEAMPGLERVTSELSGALTLSVGSLA